jgi:hypothetical protein
MLENGGEMNSKQITLSLGEDVYLFLQTRAAIDELRIEEGAAQILTHIATSSPLFSRFQSISEGARARVG